MVFLLAFNFVNVRGEFFYMFGRCCPRPRPRPMCMPHMPMHHHAGACGLPRPVISVGGGCQITQGPQEVVVEPPVVAAPNIFHHHHSVAHIQPVITQDIHNIHCHHKYVVQEQKKCDEVLKHTHGLCGPPITRPATPCPPCPPMPCCR